MKTVHQLHAIFLSIILLASWFCGILPAKCPPGDVDGNCQLDLTDLAALAQQWLAPASDTPSANLNSFNTLSANWLIPGIPVAINEFMAANSGFIADPDDPAEDWADWIELYNYGTWPVDLGGFWVTDTLTTPMKAQIPADQPDKTTIQPGQFMLLWADNDPGQGPLHLDLNLNENGSDIGIFAPGGTEVDAVTFTAMAANQSQGRLPDGAGSWLMFNAGTALKPTPGQPNHTPSPLTIDAPALPVVNGRYVSDKASIALSGKADGVTTHTILVNGREALWQPLTGIWTIGDNTAGQLETLVARAADWYYLDNGTNQYQIQDGIIWYSHPNYGQTGWKGPSPAPLGYNNPVTTTIGYGPSSSKKFITSYFRKTFTVNQPGRYGALTLRVLRDDGIVVFINGRLAKNDHIIANPTYLTLADSPAVDGNDETTYFEYAIDPTLLIDGTNLVAAEVHQQLVSSSDLSFDVELIATVKGDASNNVPLQPGVNTITVQSFDGQIPPALLQEASIDVVRPQTLSGALTADATLAAGSVWNVTGDIIIPSGRSLTIQPGVMLQFNNGTGITVNGLLTAAGTEAQPITMIPTPTAATRWDGIRFAGTLQPNRLSHVHMEYGDQQGDSVQVAGSRAVLEYMTFKVTGNGTQILDFDHPRVIVRGCVLPVIGGVEPVHGANLTGEEYAIFERNTFGGTTGYNDIIDFTGGQRPGPIVQFYDNIFLGGGDDGVDLDETDGHVEGNIFMNFHQTTPTQDSPSYGVATGYASQVCVVRNTFINNDHAILHKEDVYCWIQNNTIVNCTIAAVSFGEPFRSTPRDPGRGCYMDSNICWNNAALFQHYFDNPADYGPTGPVYIYRSIVPTPWLGLGSGNSDADPLFVNSTTDLALQAGSPARGSGQNGLDMGSMVPAGATVRGEPTSPTTQTTASLTVGGPGVVAYQYRLIDNGIASSWSAETALPINSDDYPANPDSINGTITLNSLQAGHEYRVEVRGKNSAGLWQGQLFKDTDFVAPGDPDGASTAAWIVE